MAGTSKNQTGWRASLSMKERMKIAGGEAEEKVIHIHPYLISLFSPMPLIVSWNKQQQTAKRHNQSSVPSFPDQTFSDQNMSGQKPKYTHRIFAN